VSLPASRRGKVRRKGEMTARLQWASGNGS
jgi:hypothetical protein